MSTTIAEALRVATETLRPASDTPRLDAELLLAHALGWPRARLLAEGRADVPAAALADYTALVERRAALESVAYLLGHREFFGLDFVVDRRVLVPRPETELLVELALAAAANGQQAAEQPAGAAGGAASSLVIADIGTGSGCIAVALAVHLPGARVYAVDVSPGALEVAADNVARHGVAGRVALLRGDLLEPLPEPVDLLVSNPPYTVLSEIDEGVRRHEPRAALDGGPDGLHLYRRLLAGAPARIREGGAVLLEIGATQGAQVAALARAAFPDGDITVHQDLAALDRVVRVLTAPPRAD